MNLATDNLRRGLREATEIRERIGTTTAKPVDSSTMTQSMWADYRKYNAPSVGELSKLAEDTSLVDSATNRSNSLYAQNTAQVDRVLGRRTSTMSPAQKRMLRDRLASVSATDGTSGIYNARLAQRDVNNAAVNSAMDIAATMDGQALSSMTAADQLKMSRDAQNEANRRAAKSGFLGFLGQVGGNAIPLLG